MIESTSSDAANFGKYIVLDFGIMGTLSETDKSYLAQNFLASSAATTIASPPRTSR